MTELSPIIQATTILGADGKPFQDSSRKSVSDAVLGPSDRFSMLSSYGSYIGSVFGLESSALVRTLEPYINHAWVFAGAAAIAQNLSQAPFTVYRETANTLTERAAVARSAGRPWIGPNVGRRRSAVRRHLMNRDREHGVRIRGLTEDPDSPWQPLFDKPNFLMTSDQFWTAHWIWLMIRGEVFWVLSMDDGEPYQSGDIPDQIFPMSPDIFRPRLVGNTVVAWQMRTPQGFGGGYQGALQTFLPEEVIQFRYFNPRDTLRGLSPLSAAAGGINLDMMSIDSDRALMQNGSEPRGILQVDDKAFATDREKAEFERGWNQRHRGEKNSGRTAILQGMKYVPTSLTPKDMEHLESRKWNREEQLAVIGVPKTAVGVTDQVNKATAKTIDRNFWEKTLIPKARHTEQTIDGVLFFHESDSMTGAFDFTRVDALREGIDDKISAAQKLAGPELHCPPRIAYEVVGLPVPEYSGDEEVIVSGMVTTLTERLESAALPPSSNNPDEIQPPENPNSQPADEQPPEGDLPDDTDNASPPAKQSPQPKKVRRSARQRAMSGWRTLTQKIQQPAERQFADAWKNFVRKERQVTLARFDERTSVRQARNMAARVKADFDVDSILPDIAGVRNRLKQSVSKVYDVEHQTVYDWTIDELGGVPVIHIDDPTLLKVIEDRKDILVGSAPETLQRNLRDSMQKGITDGETLSQLRDRVSNVYNLAASPAKTLMVARTESAGTMNSIRNAVFRGQGVETVEWSTAEDEHVRETHEVYGAAGPQSIDFNFLTLTDDEGSLTFPGDPDAPAGEVINCRCCLISGTTPDADEED